MTDRSMKYFFKRINLRLICNLLICSTVLCAFCGCYDAVARPDEFKTSARDTISETAPADPPAPKKRVALTFDDGPQNYERRTCQIVDELSKYQYHATFFVVGNRIGNGSALTYAVNAGNEIGIHGYTHEVYYGSCSDEEYREEITQTANAITDVLPDYEIKLMRPIGGDISNYRIVTSPYSVILWNVDSYDYNNKYYSGISDEETQNRVNTTVENVMSAVSDGSIILMHDIYESTYDAVKIILQRLNEEGYEVVTVSELLGDTLQPGQSYSRAPR